MIIKQDALPSSDNTGHIISPNSLRHNQDMIPGGEVFSSLTLSAVLSLYQQSLNLLARRIQILAVR